MTFDSADAELSDLVISGADDDSPVHRLAPMEFVLAATGRLYPIPPGLDETVNIYRD